MLKWLRQLLASDDPSEMVDYAVLGADMHSHLIPGIDDGSQSVEESIELLRALNDLGFRKVITTPHIMGEGDYQNTPETILPGLEKVRQALAETHLSITIEAAAEYYYDEHFKQLIKEKQLLTFADNYVLFELPMMNMPRELKDTIFSMTMEAYKPVLAHVERYRYLFENKWEELEHIKQMGTHLQVNIGAFLGIYGPDMASSAYKLVERGMVDFIASDLHNEKHLGYLKAALQDKKFNAMLQQYSFLNSEL